MACKTIKVPGHYRKVSGRKTRKLIKPYHYKRC